MYLVKIYMGLMDPLDPYKPWNEVRVPGNKIYCTERVPEDDF